MKRSWWHAGGLVLAVVVVVGLGGSSNRAHDGNGFSPEAERDISAAVAAQPNALRQETKGLSAEEMRDIEVDVERASAVSLSAGVQDFTGEFTEKNVQAQITAVLKEIVRQKVDFSLGDFRPVPIIILKEPPNGNVARMAIGVALPRTVQVGPPLRLERFRSAKAVRHIHLGP